MFAGAIARRRRCDAAQQAVLIRAAVWGDDAQFDELRRELMDDDDRDTTQALAAMGIAVRRKRSGSGGDDGQPDR